VLLARILAILAQHRRETIVIVKPNQPRRIILKLNLNSISPQNFVESREMQRLSFDERPVKIEYDSANHYSGYFPTRSNTMEARSELGLTSSWH
jgi:hypothetical protein